VPARVRLLDGAQTWWGLPIGRLRGFCTPLLS